ncbi:MAG: carboxypeptidase regulatory-like domain-containing protein [Rhodospirillales bacterium]|nr:MAG: carboxypeptidase regulatory-like domain-containing protein [Rhodospirillales bacterium]
MALLAAPGPVLGHAALIDVMETRAVTIHARYDTGQPLAEAQVAVFAPDDPRTPWLTGRTDADGRFSFVPDGREGRWAIQARQAGHGAMGYITWGAAEPGEATMLALASPAATDGLQRLVLAACVVWACISTALYFRRRPAGHKGAR